MAIALTTEQLSPTTYKDYTKFVSLIRFIYRYRHKATLPIMQLAMATQIERILQKDSVALEKVLANIDTLILKAYSEPVPPGVFLVAAYSQASSYLERPADVNEDNYKSFMLALGYIGAACYDKDPANVLDDLIAEFERTDHEFNTWMLQHTPSPSKETH